jgi:hypothetical protein
MRWVLKITSSLLDTSTKVEVELETGWITNTWSISQSNWSHRIGKDGHGWWQYYKGKTFSNTKWPVAFPQIKLYQGKNELVATLDVERYPLKVGDQGFARVFIDPGVVLQHYDTEFSVIR